MRPFAARSLGLACLAAWTPTWAAAATFTLNPSADLFVNSASPTSNYGGAGALAAAAPGAPLGEFQSLLRFDLAAARASFDAALGAGRWQLTSASLQLTAVFPRNPIFNDSAAGPLAVDWLPADSWNEGTGSPNATTVNGVAWNSLASILSPGDEPLGSVAFNGGVSGLVSIPLAPTAGLQADATAGRLASLRLYVPAGASTAGVFNSRTILSPASRPLLTLEASAVPEPAALLPAATALAALGFRRRHGRRSRHAGCSVVGK